MLPHPCIGLFAFAALACFHSTLRAQTPPALEIGTYAGLSITAPEAGFWDIEATYDLSQAEGWTVLEELVYVEAGQPTVWVDSSAPIAGKRFYRAALPPVRPVPNMVAISPGTFLMGSPVTETDRAPDEGPQTQVTLTNAFYMGKYEVTQAEYLAVMMTNPSVYTGDLNRPVETVSWDNATAYCLALTNTERAAGRCLADWSYRLPTEAEWEYACRAGTTTRFSHGDDLDGSLLSSYAWYQANSGGTTQPVGQKLPNPWGLYDMHGNLDEWCLDTWDSGSGYLGGSLTDPLRDLPTDAFHITRSGSFGSGLSFTRSAARLYAEANDSGNYLGFRVVLAPDL